MPIVLRSLHGWRLLFAAIAGSLLAMASASLGETMADPGSGVLLSTTCIEPITVADSGRRDATATQRARLDAGLFCFGPYTLACTSRLALVADPSLNTEDLGKCTYTQPAAPPRVMSHPRMRVTRLQNGSILCCRDRPRTHIVAALFDPNDDTASDGDESSDDDDSQDDQNGSDDTEPQVFAWWSPATVLYLLIPERKATKSWIVPSFPPFLKLERLRC